MTKKNKHTTATTPSPSGRAGVGLKVCGMKYQDNIQQVAALQPDYLGFIFYDKSARHFDGIIPKLPESIKRVGVFVDAELDDVIEKIKTHNLQAVQLHGEETPEYCEALKKRHSEFISESHHENLKQVLIDKTIEIIKVFSIKKEFNFDVLKPYEAVCDYFLFDTKGKLPGGNGYTFDWNVLKNYPSTKPFFLSGGIGLEEVENLKQFQQSKASKYCYAIDVNSRFEIEPGLKNIEKLKIFKDTVITKERNSR
ncbi:phosphoribosylanthranilate isomerase [Mariniflexile sp.]|uniref:phosphoribosylanthranilate isomerase n=1 Tax=Mariniflexile sp. TaxID=1979402 RepID=UPI004048671A